MQSVITLTRKGTYPLGYVCIRVKRGERSKNSTRPAAVLAGRIVPATLTI